MQLLKEQATFQLSVGVNAAEIAVATAAANGANAAMVVALVLVAADGMSGRGKSHGY